MTATTHDPLAYRAEDLPKAVRILDTALAATTAVLLTGLALAFGGVTPAGHVFALGTGVVLSVLLALRVVSTGRLALSLALVPAILFVGLGALQTKNLPLDTLASLQPETAATWQEILSDPSDEAGDAALASRPLSLARRETREQFRLLLVGLIALWASIQLGRTRGGLRQLLWYSSLGAGLIGLIGVLQIASGAEKILWTYDAPGERTGGSFVHRGHYAQYLNLGFGAAFALLCLRLSERSPEQQHELKELFKGVTKPGRRVDLWLLGICLVCLIGVGLSQARSGVIAALLGATLLGVVAGRSGYLKGVGWPLAVLFVDALAVVFLLGFDPVFDRFAELPEHIDPDRYTRLAIWSDAMDLVGTYPVFGTGLGTFEWTFPAFDTSARPGTVAHAESSYVEVLAETGLVGAGLMLCAIGFVIAAGIKRVRKHVTPRHAVVFGLGFGLFALAFHQTTDFGIKTPAVALFGIVCAGVLLGVGSRLELKGTAAKAVGAIGFLGLAGWTGLQLPDAITERTIYLQTEEAEDRRVAERRRSRTWRMNTGFQADMIRRYEDAQATGGAAGLAKDPDIAYWHAYHLEKRGLERAFLAPETAMGAFEAPHTVPSLVASAREAEAWLMQTRIDAPTHGRLWALLGQFWWRYLEKPESGLLAVERASKLAPHDPYVCFARGTIEMERGDRAAAVEWIRRAMDVGLPLGKALDDILYDFPDAKPEEIAFEAAKNDARRITNLLRACEIYRKELEKRDADREALRARWVEAEKEAKARGETLEPIRLESKQSIEKRRARIASLAAVEERCSAVGLDLWLARAASDDINWSGWLSIGEFAYRQQDWRQSKRGYRNYFVERSKNPAVRLRFVQVLLELGEFASAEKELDRAVRNGGLGRTDERVQALRTRLAQSNPPVSNETATDGR